MKPNDERRGWFMGCSCGADWWVENAAIRSDSSCEHCASNGDPHRQDLYDMGISAWDSLVTHELGWCSCGSPELVDDMMLAYLASREPDDWPKPEPEGVDEQAAMLLAYIADQLDWTEHGGSVGGAWLTDNGREALANLRATAHLRDD